MLKNINLQIKNIKKHVFFQFYKKTFKNALKTLNYSIHST